MDALNIIIYHHQRYIYYIKNNEHFLLFFWPLLCRLLSYKFRTIKVQKHIGLCMLCWLHIIHTKRNTSLKMCKVEKLLNFIRFCVWIFCCFRDDYTIFIHLYFFFKQTEMNNHIKCILSVSMVKWLYRDTLSTLKMNTEFIHVHRFTKN